MDANKPETLGAKQRRFAKSVGLLIAKAHELGYEITLGDAYRDPRLHGNMGVKQGYGHPNSNHKVRLAIDLNLFRDGEFLEQSKDHEPLGTWWESLGPDYSWGGRFNDGNHYSISHGGFK